MLRAVWETGRMRYQIVDIPVSLLQLSKGRNPLPVGTRINRRSLGADVVSNGEVLYRVHFDGSDGKCSIRNLRMADCDLLLEWEKLREPAAVVPGPETAEV